MYSPVPEEASYFGNIAPEERIGEPQMYSNQRRNSVSKTSALLTYFMRSRARMLLVATPLVFTVICIFLATASSAEEMEKARRTMPSVSAVAPVQWSQELSQETKSTTEDGEESTTAITAITTVSAPELTTPQNGSVDSKLDNLTESEQSSNLQPPNMQLATASAGNISETVTKSSESLANITNDNMTGIVSVEKQNAKHEGSTSPNLKNKVDGIKILQATSKWDSNVLSTKELSNGNITNTTMANDTYSVLPSPNVGLEQKQNYSNPGISDSQSDSNLTNHESGNDVGAANMTLLVGGTVTFITEMPPTLTNPMFSSAPNINTSDCTGNASLCAGAVIQSNQSKNVLENAAENSTMWHENQSLTSAESTHRTSPTSAQLNESSMANTTSPNWPMDSNSTKIMKENSEDTQERIMSTLNGIPLPVGNGNNETIQQLDENNEDSTDGLENQEQEVKEDDDNEEQDAVETEADNKDHLENNSEMQNVLENKLDSLSDDIARKRNLMVQEKWKTSFDNDEW